MGGILVVKKPSFIFVQDEMEDYFNDHMWSAYNFEARNGQIPKLIDVISEDVMWEICDMFTSWELYGDMTYFHIIELSYNDDDKEPYYEACSMNYNFLVLDAEKLLEWQKLSLDVYGNIENMPIKGVW